MDKKTETTIIGYMSGCTIITGINSITTSIIAIMIVYPSFWDVKRHGDARVLPVLAKEEASIWERSRQKSLM